jgi:ferredoxin-like protein FixX
MEYRAQLWAYLQARKQAIAPNLTVMVGELVGARLIAHAGSLMNLAKQPASTVQILGAEKALFRALKTKHDTPKYGLIYHASLIGQAPPKHKGKISRVLAAKTALSIRVDALGDSSEPTIAIDARAKVEARMRQLELGSRAGASGAPKARKSEGGGAGAGAGAEVAAYATALEASWVWEELRAVRNYHPSFRSGLAGGMLYSGLSAFVLKGREPWTLSGKHGSAGAGGGAAADAAATEPAWMHERIAYPKPDGVLSFDLLTNLARSGTSHEADQPAHLRVKPGAEGAPARSCEKWGAPESRFCPAGVYEYPEPGKLVINAQNCVHCKTCDIKTPENYIKWTVPEAGGGGPS